MFVDGPWSLQRNATATIFSTVMSITAACSVHCSRKASPPSRAFPPRDCRPAHGASLSYWKFRPAWCLAIARLALRSIDAGASVQRTPECVPEGSGSCCLIAAFLGEVTPLARSAPHVDSFVSSSIEGNERIGAQAAIVSPAGDRDAQHPAARSTWLHDEAQSSAILVHASRKLVEVPGFKPLLSAHSPQNFVSHCVALSALDYCAPPRIAMDNKGPATP